MDSDDIVIEIRIKDGLALLARLLDASELSGIVHLATSDDEDDDDEYDEENLEPGDIYPRSVLSEKKTPDEEGSIDLSEYNVGDEVLIPGDVPLGYRLGSSDRVMQVKNLRIVYEVEGQKILSLNQLEEGVVPIPNQEIDTGLFCQETGVEVLEESADQSRIRFRKILCPDLFIKYAEELRR